ncbi:hypothetical protein GCM10025865_18330 [Paraoerskovia sediminicola]|uniref:Uncharacterized protein n=1 Tax=Paraoerskovia sediminicola TaxID=1138587 RepID=A0ABN6XCL9_9CELL|nr:hypothetical protein [Paraoerskovia sediminicola]BDZ42534.1 hypothetical protein GCM10025865_18330 [Paraoerskovia sediminicola]
MLIVLLLPPALAEYASAAGLVTGLELPSTAVVVAGSALALAVSAAAVWFLLRDLQVRSSSG